MHNRRLVVHQRMQRDHRAQQAADVHDEHLVVRRRREARRQLGVVQVRQQVERVLEVVRDLVVQRHLALGDLGQVGADVGQARLEAAQRGELLGDAGRERGRGGVFDVPQEVLDADLLGLFGLDRGGDVQEGLSRLRAVLENDGM